ncbi:hypothetical protein ACHAXT_007699 [Thalassiosira profunda]
MTVHPHNEAPPTTSSLRAILSSQRHTLRLFLSNPRTRTPITVLYVASFGGALHHAVTTYYYLAIGANEMDIGQLGFIMSVGALVGSPISGLALDKYGPWIPISVTAGCCAWGCLWRGMASGLASLRAGAILLGVGVNLWTVVLGHLAKSFPASMRSEVLSGFGVQTTLVQLAGKGVFPFVEYALHRMVGMEDALKRYRIHMGLCTFFCFYGTFALFWDRRNVQQQQIGDKVKYMHKHSDIVDELEVEDGSDMNNGRQFEEVELTSTSSVNGDSVHSLSMSERGESFADNSREASLIDETEPKGEPEATPQTASAEEGSSSNPRRANRHLVTTLVLTLALLLQAVSTTVLTVLWPLLAHDRFDLSAHVFGVLTFVSSVASTGAVAAFPVVERWEKVGGRVRCAGWGFGLGAVLCALFCVCSFGDYWSEVEGDFIGTAGDVMEVEASANRLLGGGESGAIQQLHWRKRFLLHALSAMALQSALFFLEPSLKSLLSIVVHAPSSKTKSSSLGGVVGFMQTLGSIGGMIGNLAGTYAYKLSKDAGRNAPHILQGGSLPFVAAAICMLVVSALIFSLEEPAHLEAMQAEEGGYSKLSHDGDVEHGRASGGGGDGADSEPGEAEQEATEGCCLALRETTYDLKLD